MTAADTVVEEGVAFLTRHPDLSGASASTGALVWGLWRALYECPSCPGVVMAPLDGLPIASAKSWGCRQCGGTWEWRDTPEAPSKPKRKAKHRG